jgi:HlyD family secretion protein
MFRKYIIPFLAVAGVAFAVFTVLRGDRTPPQPPPFSDAPQAPYQSFVAGSGIVEASTENISIGTHIGGIVSKVFVRVGDNVKASDVLFAIDDRAIRAELIMRQAAVQVAEAQVAGGKYEIALAESLGPGNNISVKEYQRQRFALQKAEAQLTQAQAELKSSETNLELLTVRASVDGQVLQLKVHPGEFAPASLAVVGQPALILLGSVTPLHVRVDVDENDASRASATAPAVGYLRGNKDISSPLRFMRFEPYVVPKKSLTGDTTERVDTRVLQIIYSFERNELPIFVGQQMDVFIEAAPHTSVGTNQTVKP